MMYIHAHQLGKSLVNGSVAIEDEKLACVDLRNIRTELKSTVIPLFTLSFHVSTVEKEKVC